MKATTEKVTETKGGDRTRHIGGRQCQVSYNGNPCYCKVNADVFCVQVNRSIDVIIESDDAIERFPENGKDLDFLLQRKLRLN